VEYFVRGGISPADRNTLGWAVDTGVAWTGPVPGRPQDVAALGLAHARFSRRFADGVRLADPAATTPDFEQVIELSYTVALNENLTIQPDLQFIRHPGGSAAQRNALVFLLRLNRSY
jgi:porin